MPVTPEPRSVNTNTAGGNVFSPGGGSLNASSDSSSCEFLDWFVGSQSMGGMWMRKWVFNSNATLGYGGTIPSGCPQISFSYCDVNFWVATDAMVQRASYCSGGASAMDIDYASDETYGGFGVSGTFWTTTQGYMRRKALVTDPKSESRYRNGNTVTSQIPGEYSYGSAFDSSGNFASNFQRVISSAAALDSNFDPNLVTI